MDCYCSQHDIGIHHDGERCALRRIEQLESLYNMAQGWWYAQACSMIDKGEDIRQAEFPALVDECNKALRKVREVK